MLSTVARMLPIPVTAPDHGTRSRRPDTAPYDAARPGTARPRFRPARRAMELEARAEPRSPRAGRGEEDEELRLAKRRKVLCSEFAAVTSSDEAVASGFLASSGWHLEVGPAAGGRGERPPFLCTLPLCFRGRWTLTSRRR